MIKKIKAWRNKSKSSIDEVKDLTKEVSTFAASNLPANIQENRKTLFDLITKYNSGELAKEAIIGNLRAGFVLLNCATKDEQDQIMKCILDVELDIKSNEEMTNDQYDKYHEIISYIHNKRQEGIKILLKKIAHQLNNKEISISKETIDFITSITDSQLETIKEIFRYVVGHSILNYKNIAEDFKANNFNQVGSDNIKFLGRIFYNQDVIGGKSYNQKLEAVNIHGILIWKYLIPTIQLKGIPTTEDSLTEHLSNEENKKVFAEFLKNLPVKGRVFAQEKVKFYITKHATSAGEIELNIPCFTILTDMGVELHSLLKDEINEYPNGYLQSVVDEEQYRNFGLTFETN